MKTACLILVVIIVALLATGCKPVSGEATQLSQFRDDANGVVCYVRPGSPRSLSCVKVRP